MLPSPSIFALVCLLCFLQITSAAPDPRPSSQADGQTVPLVRRQRLVARSVEDWGVWAENEREALMVKYGGSAPSTKRSQGTNLLINQNTDASYIGSLAIGTPPVAFYITLDTGSSDLWVAGVDCTMGCSRLPTYDPSASSTAQNLSQSFSITYGSGQAAGDLFSDVVQMAGFSVTNQSFGAATQVSDGLLSAPVSGLLGLGWQSNAASGQVPFWQTLASKGALSEPVMAFQLTRFLNDSSARVLEPGGSFTMGFVNTSLYTGNIDYQRLVSTPSFWVLAITKLTVQGNSVSLPSGSASYAAIDTGTTLVGGPSSVIQNVYSQIPGSQPGTGNWQGFWTYPCSTPVNVAMSFGGPSWPISPADFQLTQIGSNTCVGALFEINTQGSAPSWIVGDTFLKNVYSVFRYSPASVGFAALSVDAVNMNGVNGQPPTATIGSVATSVTASVVTASSTSMSGARRGLGVFLKQQPALSTDSVGSWRWWLRAASSSVVGPLVVVCGVVVGAMLA